MSATATTEIIRDTFGMQEGEVFCRGLVDAEDEDDFDLQLEKLYNGWDAFAPEFYKWFVEVQANSFHTCMIAPVHEKAKLGSPPPRYTTNSNESANSTVKRWVGFSKSSWPSFIRI